MQGSSTVSGSNPMVILNRLISSGAGTVSINVTGGTTVGGDISVYSGVLNFTPATASDLTVANGSYVTGTFSFSPVVSGTANVNQVLYVNGGTATFGGAVANVNILGNVTNNGTLNFTPSSPSTVSHAGSSTQTLGGTNAYNFGANALLEVSNAAGATLSRNITVASTSTGYPGVNPLPVELTKFVATTKASGIALDWATASEKNSASFEVQRSANGASFETIIKVAAQGNSAVAHSYASLDRTPLLGLAHHRLRQVDADGTVAYSPVVTARWTVGGEAGVYLNPTSGPLYLGHPAEAGKFRVLNGQGHAQLTGQNSAAGLDVQELPAGIYLLEIVTESGRSVQRFVRE